MKKTKRTKRSAPSDIIGRTDEGADVTFDQLAGELRRSFAISDYNDIVGAYNLTRPRNGLLLWMGLAHCRHEGLPVPENLQEALAHYADRLLTAAQSKAAGSAELARALDLLPGAKGLSAFNRAQSWVRKCKAFRQMIVLQQMTACGRHAAAKAVAPGFGLTPGTLLKDFSRYVEQTPKDAHLSNPWAARLPPLPKKRSTR